MYWDYRGCPTTAVQRPVRHARTIVVPYLLVVFSRRLSFGFNDPANGSDQEVFQKPAGRIGSSQKVLKISGVESCRIRRFSNVTGSDRVTKTRSNPPEEIRPVNSAGIIIAHSEGGTRRINFRKLSPCLRLRVCEKRTQAAVTSRCASFVDGRYPSQL